MRPAPFLPVAPGVLVATSRQMTTTTTLVVRDGRALLVDPGWLPDELVAIADDLAALELQVTAGVATHPHHDHVLWHPRLGDGPRWASARAAAAAVQRRTEHLAALGPDYPPEVLALVGRLTALPGTDRVGAVATIPDPFGPDGPGELVQLVVHGAHAPGHAAVWAADRGVLAVGDMLSDVELPLPFDPDDLPAYFAGLDVLAPYVERARVLIPGHGVPTFEPLARLDADRRYLDDALAGRETTDPRLANPGMRAEHDHLLRLVRDGAGT